MGFSLRGKRGLWLTAYSNNHVERATAQRNIPSREVKQVGFRMARRAMLWAIARKDPDMAYAHARKAARLGIEFIASRPSRRAEFQAQRLGHLKAAGIRALIRKLDGK